MKLLIILLLISSSTWGQQAFPIDDSIATNKTVKWLSQNGHPIKSVKAGSGFDDLQWLKSVLRNVKYVGLGEATHGTREFFQMKHRLLEFFVKEMGFTAFAMEASYQGCENINNYILYGIGDAHTSLASQEFFTWDTEEVIEMIEWLRNYNQTVPDKKKVVFFGFDIQIFAKSGAVDSIKNFLKKVDTIVLKKKEGLIRLFYELDYNRSLYTDPQTMKSKKPTIDSLKEEFSDLLISLAMKKGDYLLKSSEHEYNINFNRITNILQFLNAYGEYGKRGSFIDFNNARDYYLSTNFKNFVQQNINKKIVLWAHNAHINKNIRSGGEEKRFGYHLQEAYGESFFAFGFDFNKGNFQAISDSTGKLEQFTLPPASIKTLSWMLGQIEEKNFIINLRQQMPPEVSTFLESVLKIRNVGASFGKNSYPYRPIRPKNDFDAIIFINSTTRARPTVTGMR